MALLEVTGISKNFGSTHVLQNISLNLEKGEALAIIGSSGSGKTTLLRCLNFLETPDTGVIRVDGKTLWDAADPATHRESEVRKKRLHFGLVFQNFNLFPQYTALQNITLAGELLAKEKPEYKANRKAIHAELEEKARTLLAQMGLSERENHYPHQLSGGQQQRVAIARAVVNKPRLLLLDESLSALDYKLRKQMQNELKALQRKLGITFVFVTHDQEEALTMSDRIVVMRDGKIEQDGTPREIYEEPKNLFVASFIGEINIFNATVIERLDEERVRARVEGHECNITVNFAVEKGQKLCSDLQKYRGVGGEVRVLTYAALESEKTEFDVLINATSAGMYPHTGECPVSEEVVSRCSAVFDAVYNPAKTELLQRAERLGVKAIGGMEMLVFQAVAAHEIWYGTQFKASELAVLCKDAAEEMRRIFGGKA